MIQHVLNDTAYTHQPQHKQLFVVVAWTTCLIGFADCVIKLAKKYTMSQTLQFTSRTNLSYAELYNYDLTYITGDFM